MLFCHPPGGQLSGLGDGPSDPVATIFDPYGRRLLPITVDVGDQPQTWYYLEGADPSTAQPMQQLFNQITTLPEPPPPLVQQQIANPPPPAAFGSGSGQTVTTQVVYTAPQQAQLTLPPTVTTQPVGQPIPSPAPAVLPPAAPAPPPSVSAPAPAPVSTVTSPSPAPMAPVVIPGGSTVPRVVIAVPPTGADVAPDAGQPGQPTGSASSSSSGGGLAVLALLALAAFGSS